MWIYILKSKDQVFQKFVEWKALAEKSSGQKLKTLHTDNGREYTSAKFKKEYTCIMSSQCLKLLNRMVWQKE